MHPDISDPVHPYDPKNCIEDQNPVRREQMPSSISAPSRSDARSILSRSIQLGSCCRSWTTRTNMRTTATVGHVLLTGVWLCKEFRGHLGGKQGPATNEARSLKWWSSLLPRHEERHRQPHRRRTSQWVSFHEFEYRAAVPAHDLQPGPSCRTRRLCHH